MNKENTALLIIDVVNNCCHESSETPEYGIHFTKIRKMIPKLTKFVDEFRKQIGSQIIFVNITPWDKKHLAKNIIELYDNEPKSVYYSDDKTGFSERFFGIEPLKDDIVITKNAYSAFANPELEKILKEKGIQYIVIIGVFTDGCVLTTICDGFTKGFNFVILKDLIETTDIKIRQELHKNLIEYTFPILYGKTITSDEFLKDWE
ncbi:MAG: cysteine hydrolase family protein [Candidatus Pacebacteria bacterium]|nr:cysteine hydrolase family protein [Candidatus Paceibacterota bacterium]